jgi:hypothetical protein
MNVVLWYVVWKIRTNFSEKSTAPILMVTETCNRIIHCMSTMDLSLPAKFINFADVIRYSGQIWEIFEVNERMFYVSVQKLALLCFILHLF